jgi:diguanylate cyclase (GGDEF)-like protein/PAS domain S-box-containing protein
MRFASHQFQGVRDGRDSHAAEVEVRVSSTTALRRDPVLLGVAIYMAAVGIFFVGGSGAIRAESIGLWVIQIPVDLALIVLCRRVARLPAMPAPARRFWNALANGGIFFALGDFSQAVIAPRLPPLEAVVPGPVHNITLVMGVAFPLWAIATLPTPEGSRREQIRLWLDGGSVMAAAMVFAWYFSVSPGVVDANAANLRTSLLGVGIELVAAFAVVKLVLTGAAGFVREALLCGSSAVAILGLANAATPALLHSPHLYLLLATQVMAHCVLVFAPRIQELRVRTDPQVISADSKRPYSLLPYVSIAATLGLLVAVLSQGLNIRVWGVLIGVVIIIGLVVVRQLAAFTDNAELLTQLDDKEQLLRSLVQHASDITIISRDGLIAYASPALERVIGITPAEAVGRPTVELLHPEDIAGQLIRFAQLEETPRASVTYQIRAKHADGSWRWLEIISTNLLEDPAVNGIVSNARDITIAREHQEMLRHQASHDPLTQLANRTLFTERAQAAVTVTAGDKPKQVAILLIDLDDFKAVNDTLGHHVGALLIGVAERLRSCVRPGDTVARLGGDEFAILIPLASQRDATTLAERIMAALIAPIDAAGHQLIAQASIGLAQDSSDDPDSLLRAADLAMYAAKRDGKGTYSLHPIDRPA